MWMARSKHKKKSPLNAKPLRLAGQSLDEEIQRLNEDLFNWVIVAVLIVCLAISEWLKWYYSMPPQPIPITALAVIAIFAVAWKFYRFRAAIRPLILGRDGERAVGEYLEKLREKGFKVFHDLVGGNFNVDHVIIGPSGVFSIETKTLSKPTGRDARITYSERQLKADGRVFENDPIAQVKAGARWIKQILKDSTGKEFRVHPVVLFPGWFIEPIPHELSAEVWVLEPKALPKFLENQPAILPAEDISLASYHLSRYVRSIVND
jgi:hypothetical protein